MENYVTLFDSNFLAQGIALHKSMEKHCSGEYTLWILCVNDRAYEVLSNLQLSNVRLLKLSKLETPELKAVKVGRSKGEYCWTLTPFAPRFVFEAAPEVQRVTYIDADMWFMGSPKKIFREFDESKKNVLITECAYSPEHDQTATAGKFAVQFMIFDRNNGEVVRKWWEERCLEWCYARHENGMFGDQKYLDDWEALFSEYVHVFSNKKLIVAPWNATKYSYGSACLWHFHGLRINNSDDELRIFIGDYYLPKVVKEYVYDRYFIDLMYAIKLMEKNDFHHENQAVYSPLSFLSLLMRKIRRNIRDYLKVCQEYEVVRKNN